MKIIFRAFALAVFTLTIGCVVIPDTFDANINITIRHVEEQADNFLGFVEGDLSTLGGEASSNSTSSLHGAVDLFSPLQVVYASDEGTQTSTRMKQIAESMKKRFKLVEDIKKTGAVGESNRGLLELVKPELITIPEKKNELQRIMADENKDRKALHQEVARLNADQKMTTSTVEKVYANKRLERGKKGELFQLPAKGETFDKFKVSKMGKALGDKCIASAWVILPISNIDEKAVKKS